MSTEAIKIETGLIPIAKNRKQKDCRKQTFINPIVSSAYGQIRFAKIQKIQWDTRYPDHKHLIVDATDSEDRNFELYIWEGDYFWKKFVRAKLIPKVINKKNLKQLNPNTFEGLWIKGKFLFMRTNLFHINGDRFTFDKKPICK